MTVTLLHLTYHPGDPEVSVTERSYVRHGDTLESDGQTIEGGQIGELMTDDYGWEITCYPQHQSSALVLLKAAVKARRDGLRREAEKLRVG